MPAADRVLDFAQSPAYLSVRNEQLVIRSNDNPTITVPIAEIAVVLLSGPAVTLTQPVLAALLAANACLVVAGANHLPAGMLLPISSNALSTQRLGEQINMSQPTRKRLWQSVVIAKILAQAAVLEEHGGEPGALRALASRVRSGDPDNLESTAAQRYWPLLFGAEFRRRTDAADCNRLLNYGYAVLRASLARSICAAGLHPSLGIQHRSRSNPFCLADDLMEPYRPLIDSEVRRIVGEWGNDVSLMPAIKQRLVEAVHRRIEHDGEWRDSWEWFDRTAQSLLSANGASLARIFYPNGILRAPGA
jgi:CRISPR-associated protein Cas1